ncbi:hypothetical protein [Streptomyces amritsarensis]|uniref:hypothetical protein n=1 Tax=Streptomyces amritsarensis TaxID=681158 RepID=UPI00369F576E
MLKWTAWPAVPVTVAVLAVRRGKRAAFRAAPAAGLAALTLTPAVLVDAGAFYQNVVLYPLGLGPTASSARSPLLGHLIVLLLPHGRAVTTALIALSAVGVGASLLVRPPVGRPPRLAPPRERTAAPPATVARRLCAATPATAGALPARRSPAGRGCPPPTAPGAPRNRRATQRPHPFREKQRMTPSQN